MPKEHICPRCNQTRELFMTGIGLSCYYCTPERERARYPQWSTAELPPTKQWKEPKRAKRATKA